MALKVRRVRSSKHWNSRRSIRLCRTMPMHSSTRLCSWALCLTCSVDCQCKRLQPSSIKLRLINCLKQLVRLVPEHLSTMHSNLRAALRAVCLVSLNTQRVAASCLMTWAVKLKSSLRAWTRKVWRIKPKHLLVHPFAEWRNVSCVSVR